MLKKNKSKNVFFDDDDVVVIDKKTKRRMERARREQQRQAEAEAAESASASVEESVVEEEPADDAMAQLARFGQESNWREAVLTCRRAIRECEADGREEMVLPLQMALEKLEMSLRRQMAAAFMIRAKEMLKKEYLLDVGE